MIRRYSRIADIPATDWDRAAAIGGFYATAAWAELYEPLSPTYVVARDDGDVLAAAPVYSAPHPGEFPAIADAMFPTADAYPLAIAGPVRGYSTRTCVRSELAPDRRRHVIAELAAEVRRVAEDAGARTWGFAYVPREDAHELCAI